MRWKTAGLALALTARLEASDCPEECPEWAFKANAMDIMIAIPYGGEAAAATLAHKYHLGFRRLDNPVCHYEVEPVEGEVCTDKSTGVIYGIDHLDDSHLVELFFITQRSDGMFFSLETDGNRQTIQLPPNECYGIRKGFVNDDDLPDVILFTPNLYREQTRRYRDADARGTYTVDLRTLCQQPDGRFGRCDPKEKLPPHLRIRHPYDH